MKEKQLRRSLAVLPIGTVMKLTDLSARQIRYYEDQDLVHPQRSASNRRMYSLNDVDRLLEIKDYLADGLNIKAIRKIYQGRAAAADEDQSERRSEADLRRDLQDEILEAGGFGRNLGQGPRL